MVYFNVASMICVVKQSNCNGKIRRYMDQVMVFTSFIKHVCQI